MSPIEPFTAGSRTGFHVRYNFRRVVAHATETVKSVADAFARMLSCSLRSLLAVMLMFSPGLPPKARPEKGHTIRIAAQSQSTESWSREDEPVAADRGIRAGLRRLMSRSILSYEKEGHHTAAQDQTLRHSTSKPPLVAEHTAPKLLYTIEHTTQKHHSSAEHVLPEPLCIIKNSTPGKQHAETSSLASLGDLTFFLRSREASFSHLLPKPRVSTADFQRNPFLRDLNPDLDHSDWFRLLNQMFPVKLGDKCNDIASEAIEFLNKLKLPGTILHPADTRKVVATTYLDAVEAFFDHFKYVMREADLVKNQDIRAWLEYTQKRGGSIKVGSDISDSDFTISPYTKEQKVFVSDEAKAHLNILKLEVTRAMASWEMQQAEMKERAELEKAIIEKPLRVARFRTASEESREEHRIALEERDRAHYNLVLKYEAGRMSKLEADRLGICCRNASQIWERVKPVEVGKKPCRMRTASETAREEHLIAKEEYNRAQDELIMAHEAGRMRKLEAQILTRSAAEDWEYLTLKIYAENRAKKEAAKAKRASDDQELEDNYKNGRSFSGNTLEIPRYKHAEEIADVLNKVWGVSPEKIRERARIREARGIRRTSSDRKVRGIRIISEEERKRRHRESFAL